MKKSVYNTKNPILMCESSSSTIPALVIKLKYFSLYPIVDIDGKVYQLENLYLNYNKFYLM